MSTEHDGWLKMTIAGHGFYTASPEAVDAAWAYFASKDLSAIRRQYVQEYGTGSISGNSEHIDWTEYDGLSRSQLMVMAGEWCLGLHLLAEAAYRWWRATHGTTSPIPYGKHHLLVAMINQEYEGGWEKFAADNASLFA